MQKIMKSKVVICIVSICIIISLVPAKSFAWGGPDDNTHKYITKRALEILKNDKGITNYFNTDALVEYSVDPDYSETDFLLGYFSTYQGHFYDPFSYKNWLGYTEPTAKTRFLDHYKNALEYYREDDFANAWKELGRSLHYIEDATEPHHAANKIAKVTDHSDFEDWCGNAIAGNTAYNVYSSNQYDTVSIQTLETTLSNCAVFANGSYYLYENFPKEKYPKIAMDTLTYAQKIVAAVLYRFFLDTGGVENLADKTSVYESSVNISAANAVDGKKETVSKTQNEPYPWWKIDLSTPYSIGKIEITPGEPLNDFYISLLDENGNEIWQNSFYKNTSDTFTIDLEGLIGRYLIIQSKSNYCTLSLAEVTISKYLAANVFKFDTATGAITDYVGKNRDAIIPTKYYDMDVKAIAPNAFLNKNIVSVTIPGSVKSIGSNAFSNCSSLRSAYFEGIAPNNFDKSVFQGASQNFSIYYKPGAIGFSNIEYEPSSFIFDSTTGTIRGYRGKGGYVKIPKQINGIDVKTIGANAFTTENCKTITNISIPDSVTSISDNAFYNCSSLASANFEGNAPSIFGASVFNGCANNFSIYYNSDSSGFSYPAWKGYKSFLKPAQEFVFERSTGSIVGYAGMGGNVVIPDMINGEPVKAIGLRAFSPADSTGTFKYQCRPKITGVVIPDSVELIENRAFVGCDSLEYVSIGSGLKEIKIYAFGNCKALKSMYFNGNAPLIGNIFSWNQPDFMAAVPNLTIYYNPGATGFTSNLWAGLRTSVLRPEDFVFSEKTGSILSYKGAGGNVVIPARINSKDVKEISQNAFPYGNLKSITIPNSVTSIGDYAFRNSNLTSAQIPDSVESIGKYAFYTCEALIDVNIPGSACNIGDEAFAYCSSLKSVTIPDKLTSIGYQVFSGCKALQRLSIPNSVTTIGSGAFANCSSLSSIAIPDSVTGIGDAAFTGCNSLTSTIIPNSVTSIGKEAFSYCLALTDVSIPECIESIGDEAFNWCTALKSANFAGSRPKSFGVSVFDNCAKGLAIRYATRLYTKSIQPDEKYPDTNNCESGDDIFSANYSDTKSYGYAIPSGQTICVDVIVDLGLASPVNNVLIYKLPYSDYHYWPDSVLVSTSADNINYKPSGFLNTSEAPKDVWYNIKFDDVNTRYVKITFTKKNTGFTYEWLFIDEIKVCNIKKE